MNSAALLTISTGNGAPPDPRTQAYLRDFCSGPRFSWKVDELQELLERKESPDYEELYGVDFVKESLALGEDGQLFAFPSEPNEYQYNEPLFLDLIASRERRKELSEEEKTIDYEELRRKYTKSKDAAIRCTSRAFTFHRRLVWNAHIGDSAVHPSKECPLEVCLSQESAPCEMRLSSKATAHETYDWIVYLVKHILIPMQVYLNGYVFAPDALNAPKILFVRNNIPTSDSLFHFLDRFSSEPSFPEKLAFGVYQSFMKSNSLKNTHKDAFKILQGLDDRKNPMGSQNARNICRAAFVDTALTKTLSLCSVLPQKDEKVFWRQLSKALPPEEPSPPARTPSNKSSSRGRGRSRSRPPRRAEESESEEHENTPRKKQKSTPSPQHINSDLCSDPTVRCFGCAPTISITLSQLIQQHSS